jgi:hypothetical protein
MSPFYVEGDRKLDSLRFEISPTNVRFKAGLKATAYWLKCGIAIELNETVYCHRLDSLLYYFLDT